MISTDGVSCVTYLESIVGPAPKLHIARLIVERKPLVRIGITSNKSELIPGDINFAAGFEDTRWDVGAGPLVCHHHVGVVGPVKSFIRTEIRSFEVLIFWLIDVLSKLYLV